MSDKTYFIPEPDDQLGPEDSVIFDDRTPLEIQNSDLAKIENEAVDDFCVPEEIYKSIHITVHGLRLHFSCTTEVLKAQAVFEVSAEAQKKRFHKIARVGTFIAACAYTARNSEDVVFRSAVSCYLGGLREIVKVSKKGESSGGLKRGKISELTKLCYRLFSSLYAENRLNPNSVRIEFKKFEKPSGLLNSLISSPPEPLLIQITGFHADDTISYIEKGEPAEICFEGGITQKLKDWNDKIKKF